MTTGDVLLSLLLVLVGAGLLKLFDKYWRKFVAHVSVWWSARSKKTAHARLRKLAAEARLVQKYRAEPRIYFSRQLTRVVAMLSAVALMILSVVAATSFLSHFATMEAFTKLDPKIAADLAVKRAWCEDFFVRCGDFERMMAVASASTAYFAAGLFLGSYARYMRFSNLERLEQSITFQAQELRDQYGDPAEVLTASIGPDARLSGPLMRKGYFRRRPHHGLTYCANDLGSCRDRHNSCGPMALNYALPHLRIAL
jgi:hypothetical protein